MMFNPAMRCGSASHRVHSVFGVVFLALGAGATETAMSSTQLLEGPRPVTATAALRCSKLHDEAFRAIKWMTLFTLTVGTRSIRPVLVVITVISALYCLVTRSVTVSNDRFLRRTISIAALVLPAVNLLFVALSFFASET